jgi:4-hydroxy-tetrahydrodipicolinate synthase
MPKDDKKILMRKLFGGVGVALITPFKEDTSIDYLALENLVNTVITEGVDYLVVNGTTSEASTLTDQEKTDLLAFVARVNKGRKPIMYGIGANNTQHVLDIIAKTDFTHIDSVLTVSPYYNKPSQQGIIAHYLMVADACPVPLMLYNVPGRTGSNMTAATTIKLASHANIFGIKEASGNLEQCIEIVKGKPEDFMLISGDDILAVPMISIGCEGAISVLANAFPKKFTQCIHDALKDDFASASKHLHDFIPLNGLLYEESNPVGIKEVLVQKGRIARQVRLPLLNASEGLQKRISNALFHSGL